jgi:hypothetical protein
MKWINPGEAAELMNEAINGFRQSLDQLQPHMESKGLAKEFAFAAQNTLEWCETLNQRYNHYAICQICHNQLLGKEVHYSIEKVFISTYNAQIAGFLSEEQANAQSDTHGHFEITVCETCSKLVDLLALPIATQKAQEALDISREYTDDRVKEIANILGNLERRLNRIEGRLSV